MIIKHNPAFLPALLFVIAVHGGLLYALWQQRLLPQPEQMVTLLVNFVTPPKVEEVHKPDPPKPQPKPKPVEKPKPRQLVAETPVLSETEPVAPPPPSVPEPVVEAPPPPAPAPVPPGPVMLSSELAVTCPEWNPPAYPPLSRRLGEEGKLVLRVELDESGRVSVARVIESSGFKRLDESALAAVKTWRCRPSMRNGQPVRAVALQPFNFVLQGN